MSWKRSVLTDSGGFQIFSLPHSRAMSEEGAVFQSYLDGRTILLSPELSIETQKAIGSDIMMALDQCIPSTADEADGARGAGITHRWAARSLAARGDSPQAMFAIVQGALFPELRRESAAVPERDAVRWLRHRRARGRREQERARGHLRIHRAASAARISPRYLMGVGTPLDILEAVHRGVDMFDCIIPTQVAQRGGAFTSRGFLQLRRGVYKFSEEPLDPALRLPHLRALLARLSASPHEDRRNLGWQLLGQHNLHFYHQLMRDIRQSILEDRFLELYREKRAFLHESGRRQSRSSKQKPKRRMAFHRWATTKCTARRKVSPASGRSPPARSCTRAPRRWRRRSSLYIEQSDLAERLRLSADEIAGERRAAGHLGCRPRRRRQRHGGDPLLRSAGRRRARPADAPHQLRKRSRFAAARLPAQPRIHLPAPRRPSAASSTPAAGNRSSTRV